MSFVESMQEEKGIYVQKFVYIICLPGIERSAHVSKT